MAIDIGIDKEVQPNRITSTPTCLGTTSLELLWGQLCSSKGLHYSYVISIFSCYRYTRIFDIGFSISDMSISDMSMATTDININTDGSPASYRYVSIMLVIDVYTPILDIEFDDDSYRYRYGRLAYLLKLLLVQVNVGHAFPVKV